MTRRIPDLDRRIGKRWPSRFLNFLPVPQLWKYLVWRSGGDAPGPEFQLRKTMTDCRRILVVAPETFQETLVALPVIETIIHGVKDVSVRLIAWPREAAFLSGVFGRDKVLTLEPEGFYLREPHFQELLKSIQAFRPDVTVNFRTHSPPLLHFLLRSSQAPVRVQLNADAPPPFANVTLAAGARPNHLRKYLQVLKLWDATGDPVACKWARLTASKENLEKATALLASKNLRPEKTALFLWQDQPERDQSLLVRQAAESLKGQGKSLAVLHGTGSFPGATSPTPHVAAEFPTFAMESTGLTIALIAATAGVQGMNGPLLHLASLCEADVQGFFRAYDAPYDTAFLNPRLKLRVLEEKKGNEETGQR